MDSYRTVHLVGPEAISPRAKKALNVLAQEGFVLAGTYVNHPGAAFAYECELPLEAVFGIRKEDSFFGRDGVRFLSELPKLSLQRAWNDTSFLRGRDHTFRRLCDVMVARGLTFADYDPADLECRIPGKWHELYSVDKRIGTILMHNGILGLYQLRGVDDYFFEDRMKGVGPVSLPAMRALREIAREHYHQ